jgi:hypothetical protein
VLSNGAATAGATIKVQESVDNSTFTDVADTDLIGLTGNPAGVAQTASTIVKVGYIGSKRYVRVATTAGTAALFSAVVIRVPPPPPRRPGRLTGLARARSPGGPARATTSTTRRPSPVKIKMLDSALGAPTASRPHLRRRRDLRRLPTSSATRSSATQSPSSTRRRRPEGEARDQGRRRAAENKSE